MRHTLPVLLVVLLVVFAAYVTTMIRDGEHLARCEQDGFRTMRKILLAQERRRARRPDNSEEPPYQFLSQLMTGADLEELRPHSVVAGEREVFEANGYLFHVSLLDRWQKRYDHPGVDHPDVSMGERFEAWAWPVSSESSRLVIYFANQTGYLVQGENQRHLSGPDAVLPTSPMRQLQKNPERRSANWMIRLDVRRQRKDEVSLLEQR